jgi:hypothetical protein
VRQPSKKSKGYVWGNDTSVSEVIRKRKIEREGFLRKPDNCFIASGVKEVKGLSLPERQRRKGLERSGNP